MRLNRPVNSKVVTDEIRGTTAGNQSSARYAGVQSMIINMRGLGDVLTRVMKPEENPSANVDSRCLSFGLSRQGGKPGETALRTGSTYHS